MSSTSKNYSLVRLVAGRSTRAVMAVLSASVGLAVLTSCDSRMASAPAVADNSAAVASAGKGSISSGLAPSFTVPLGESGFYVLSDSRVQVGDDQVGAVELRVFAKHAAMSDADQPEAAVVTRLGAGESFAFDTFVGYLAAGDTVHVGLATDGGKTSEKTQVKYKAERAPAIPVSVFPEDMLNPGALDAPGRWAVMSDIAAGAGQARLLGWDNQANSGQKAFDLTGSRARVRLGGKADRESMAAFRAPRSGYYALHDASAMAGSAGVEARVYIGNEETAPRATRLLAKGKRASLNTELGYLQKGDVVYLAFASAKSATVDFSATVVEWAPRRAPLRVRRGHDGLLNVFEPNAPRRAIDIPANRWITVPAQEGDATEAIRKAIADAVALQQDGHYTGVRLEAGKRYVLASTQTTKGPIFEIKNSQRFVFDGNGATLFVNSPEGQRERLNLFTTNASHEVALADFAVATPRNGFSVGEVLDVSPMEKGNQTVTFRLMPDQADPVADLRRTGQAEGYGYDPKIPGRSAVGAWSHYPGADVKPQLQATDQPGVFKHTVTRTNQSIAVGNKWLIKNKGSCIQFLTATGGSENITLSGVVDQGGAGGYLLFWQASGINILDCTFEPQGTDWIASTSDGVHGRGREGVWIENTLIRGVCEDVMNTYGVTLAAQPDDQPEDNAITLGVFNNSRRDKEGEYILGDVSDDVVRAGEELVFFDPAEGRVVGYATIREKTGNRCELSNSVPGIKTWRKGAGKHNATMIYSTRGAARFFVRDSRIVDSLRFGVFIKARGGVIFNTHFEGLASSAIFAANEPEWPEGPPPTHLWLQGNTFRQNNYGYTGLNRAFLTADPAQVSIYTRRLRNPDVPAGWAAHITRGQYPISHMKIVGNTFLDWRGMGIAARNTRSLIISDNLFLPPLDDQRMRDTLASDPAMARDGVGRYAAIFMDTVNGGLISGNHFIGLPDGDQAIVRDQDVQGVIESDNIAGTVNGANLDVMLPFSEWFGPSAAEAADVGAVQDRVELRGATHRVGRLDAGLVFDGKDDLAVLKASADLVGKPLEQLSLAMWVRPTGASASDHVIYSQGDAQSGVVVAISEGRLAAGLWQAETGQWLDLGPAVDGLWQHVVLVYDGPASTLRGYVDGIEISSAKGELPAKLDAITKDASLGGLLEATRLGRGVLAPGTAAYQGALDEICLFSRSISSAEVSRLAMRRSATAR